MKSYLLLLFQFSDGPSKSVFPFTTPSLLFRLFAPGCKISGVHTQGTVTRTFHAFSANDASIANTGRKSFIKLLSGRQYKNTPNKIFHFLFYLFIVIIHKNIIAN